MREVELKRHDGAISSRASGRQYNIVLGYQRPPDYSKIDRPAVFGSNLLSILAL